MKLLLTLSFIFILNIEGFTQSINLKFVVVDSTNNSPIANANIQLSENLFTTSNNYGESVLDVNTDQYFLKISHIGYQTFEMPIDIKSDTLIKILLNPLSIKLNEIIVTSSRYDKNIETLPYSVSVIEKSYIQKDPGQSVSDILKKESGISLIRDGIWGTEISIRGLNRANIVTMIDGNRIETSTDISARLSMFDLNDIEQVEVIKGAASSLYGTGATGGTINIISKSSNYDSNLNIKANFLSGYATVNNAFSNGLNIFSSGKNWAAKISGAYRKAGDTQTPSGLLPNSQYEDYNLSALFKISPFDNHELKLNFQEFKANDVGIPGAAPLFPTNALVTYPQEERRLYSVEYKINNISNSFVKLSAKYNYQFISREVENIPGIVQYIPAGNGQPFRRVSVLSIYPSADHYVNQAQVQTDFSFSDHYLIAGLDLWMREYYGLRSRNQKIEILNSADTSVIRTINKSIYEKPIPDSKYYSAGLFIQDDFKVINKLNLTLGGRYDYIWINNEETLNPLYEITDGTVNNTPAGQKILWQSQSNQNHSYSLNAGFLFEVSNSVNLTLSVSRSFRSPSLEERYQYIDLGSVVRVGNPDLEPEQGYYFDLGFRYLPDNLRFNSSVFINFLNNLVSEEPGTYEGRNALIKVNIGEALLYGFDYSLNYNFLKKFNFYNTLSYVRGLNQKDDENLPQIPPLNTLVGLKYLILDWLQVDLSAYLFADQDKVAEGEIETPGYAYYILKLDFLNLNIDRVHFNFTAGIENIFDKEYRNHLSTNRGLIVAEPGRNFFLKTNISF
jgi:hemoglobin/transferrin/lactoferrin receptor protein